MLSLSKHEGRTALQLGLEKGDDVLPIVADLLEHLVHAIGRFAADLKERIGLSRKNQS